MVERAKKIIDTHRYRMRPGTLAVVNVRADDADLAANYLVQRFAQGSAQIGFADRSAHLQLSVPLRGDLPAGFLNVDATLLQTDALPLLRSLRVGRLPIPDWIVDALGPPLRWWLGRTPELRTGLDALRQVRLSVRGFSVVYRWMGRAALDSAASIFGPQDRERLFRQQSLLAEHTRRSATARVSLAEVLPLLFRLAAERAVPGEAAAENRVAILVATMHVLGLPLQQLLPEAAAWPQPDRQMVTLDGRGDLAKHFMLSATIAAYADTVLADAVGLYKEIEDARSGSGFSFNDLAADRAGTSFGERAVSAETTARSLQARVASGLQDADLMPPWRDLPEFLPERVFKQRFGGVDAPAYRQLMQDIERRVAALPVLQ
jgi:hypothetical protein